MQTLTEYVYKTTLKTEFGFTDKLIKELGEPDKLVTNLHYCSGPKASLYLTTRVEEFILRHRDEFLKAGSRSM